MTQTNKCQHCGSLVPAEKAFCPNCSEPMEPEEAPARETFISGEMMATIRDDPEHYRQMPMPPVAKPPAAKTEATPSATADNRSPSVTGYHLPRTAPDARTQRQNRNGRRSIIMTVGVAAFLILLFIILLVLKVI